MKRTMTILMVLAVICIATLSANADVYVRGYYRRNGTYVRPHYRSNPDGNFYNNWSTYPNINPHTGTIGTKRTPSYSSSYSWRTPSYGTSSLSSSYSWRTPSYSTPSYSTGCTLMTPSSSFSGRGSSLMTPYSNGSSLMAPSSSFSTGSSSLSRGSSLWSQ